MRRYGLQSPFSRLEFAISEEGLRDDVSLKPLEEFVRPFGNGSEGTELGAFES